MINFLELGPPRETKVTEAFPVFDDAKIETTLSEQINAFYLGTIKFLDVKARDDGDHNLFRIIPEEWNLIWDKTSTIIGKAEPTRLQRVGLEVLSSFGLEKEKPELVINQELPDRTSIETSSYQSSWIENLRFVRQLRKTRAGKMLSISWFLRNWTT